MNRENIMDIFPKSTFIKHSEIADRKKKSLTKTLNGDITKNIIYLTSNSLLFIYTRMKLWLHSRDEFQVSAHLFPHAVTKWKPIGMRNTEKHQRQWKIPWTGTAKQLTPVQDSQCSSNKWYELEVLILGVTSVERRVKLMLASVVLIRQETSFVGTTLTVSQHASLSISIYWYRAHEENLILLSVNSREKLPKPVRWSPDIHSTVPFSAKGSALLSRFHVINLSQYYSNVVRYIIIKC